VDVSTTSTEAPAPTRRFERRAEAGDARTDSEYVNRLLLLPRNVLPHGSPIAPGSKTGEPFSDLAIPELIATWGA
jgi:hypothetical protein